MIDTALKAYTEKCSYRQQVQMFNSMEPDSYTRPVRDFTKWIMKNEVLINPISMRDYIIQLNQDDTITASTKASRRSAVKCRAKQLVSEGSLQDKTAMREFLQTLDEDPATKAPKIQSRAVTKDKYLTYEQMQELLKHCRTNKQRLFIKTLFSTGLRVRELTGIKFIDCKNNNLMMKCRVLGKGKKERFIKITWNLYREMGKKYLFETGGGKAYRPEYISMQIKKIGKLIDRNISAHTLRHSFAMAYIEQNPGKLDAVSKYLGHASTSITLDLYQHHEVDNSEILGLQL